MKLTPAALMLVAATTFAQLPPGGTNTPPPNPPQNPVLAGPFTNLASGHFYYLLAANTWSNSEAIAEAHGGHLVTINDADENDWVVDTFARYGGMSRPLWLGLTDRDAEGSFAWVSGEPLTYSKWNTTSGEPNNGQGAYEEDFAYIIQRNSGNPTVLETFWNDVPNSGYGVIPPIFGVMELPAPIDPPPPVVPPPVAIVRLGCVEVCWESRSNVIYQLEWKPTYSSTNWYTLGNPVVGSGREMCIMDAPHGTNRLYRVAVVLP